MYVYSKQGLILSLPKELINWLSALILDKAFKALFKMAEFYEDEKSVIYVKKKIDKEQIIMINIGFLRQNDDISDVHQVIFSI